MHKATKLVAATAFLWVFAAVISFSADNSSTKQDKDFRPVDTSVPLFEVTLEDIRRTSVEDFYYTRPNDPQPMTLLEKGLKKELESITDPARKASILLTLATLCSYASDGPSPATQRRYLSEALTASREANYVQAEAVAHAKLAMIDEKEGQVQKAVKGIKRALDLHRKLNMECEEAIDLVNYGMILGNNGMPKEALPHLEKALNVAREVPDDIPVAFALCNLAACHNDLDKKRGIANRLNEELQEYRKFCMPFFLYYRRINHGGLYRKARLGNHVYNNIDLLHYKPGKSEPAIPVGYIEAPYELPWPTGD